MSWYLREKAVFKMPLALGTPGGSLIAEDAAVEAADLGAVLALGPVGFAGAAGVVCAIAATEAAARKRIRTVCFMGC
jgi:hypothetical protein